MEKEKEKMNYIFKYTRDTNTKTRYTHIRKRRDFDNHVTESEFTRRNKRRKIEKRVEGRSKRRPIGVARFI